MADIEDQMEIHREISDAISQSFGMQYDEDELEAELEALEEENLNETLGIVNVPVSQIKVSPPFFPVPLHLPFFPSFCLLILDFHFSFLFFEIFSKFLICRLQNRPEPWKRRKRRNCGNWRCPWRCKMYISWEKSVSCCILHKNHIKTQYLFSFLILV
jgi:hypothetical protein